MARRIAVTVLMVAGCMFSDGRLAGAQGVSSGYRPATPTLSPWLNLYHRNGEAGPLDPYHQFVRPELDLRETLRQQDLTNQRQGAEVSKVGEQVTQMEQDRLTPIRPTGTGSVFMSYSHYYAAPGAAGRTPRASPQVNRSSSPNLGGAARFMGTGGR